MGSLNDSFQSSNCFFFFCCCLLIAVNGKSYKSAIKRSIKFRTHYVVRNHTQRLTNGRQAVRADRQLDERTDGLRGRFEQIRYPRIQLLSLSENGKANENTKQYDFYTNMT